LHPKLTNDENSAILTGLSGQREPEQAAVDLKWIEEYKTASRTNVSEDWTLLNLNVYLASRVYVIRLGVRSESILALWFQASTFLWHPLPLHAFQFAPPLAVVARF
jgi:hypothetical protein